MTTSHGTLSVASAPAVHGTRSGHGAPSSPFRQPTAVWAVAFACVVSFMGLGLVDPILPDIARQLHATPSQTELVFTSYLLITAVAMLVTGWVSSRIGAKRTLVAGLLLIVASARTAPAAAPSPTSPAACRAQLVVVGAPHDGAVGELFDMALTDQLIRHSAGQVHVVPAEVSQ